MPRIDFNCVHNLRVRWAEIDMQKVVFNGHYMTYLDTAVAEYWRAIGLAYPEGYLERYANDMYLRKASLEYHGSARYDEVLAILCRVGKLGRSSLTFQFEIWRDSPAPSDSALIAAELVYVNVAMASMRPAPLPQELRERILGYERTAPLQA